MITGVNPGLSEYQPTLTVIVTLFEAKLHRDTSEFSVSRRRQLLLASIGMIFITLFQGRFRLYICIDLRYLQGLIQGELGFVLKYNYKKWDNG